MVRTIVGRKKASPWTVMLLRQKMKAVVRTAGLKMPRNVFFLSSLSRTSLCPTRSDLTRAMARSFSACVSHRAVSGLSVRVKKEMIERRHVMMPSMAKT